MDPNSIAQLITLIEQLGVVGTPAVAVALVVWAVATRPKPEPSSESADADKIKADLAALANRVSYIEGSLGIK